MAIPGSATAGIIMAVFAMLVLILVALYYTHRHRKLNTPSKATTPSSPTDSESQTHSPPPIRGSKRRTGVQNIRPQQQHILSPRLGDGPGTTLAATPEADAPASSTIRVIPITSATSSTSAMRPVPDASDKRSSLHQAVLGAGMPDGRKKDDNDSKEIGDETEAKDVKQNPVAGMNTPKTYTGAWP